MALNDVLITGIGIVSAIGTGKESFWNSLKTLKDGSTDVTLFDTSFLPSHRAGQIVDFQPEIFLGKKGLKYLDRSTQLVGCATALAFLDSDLTEDVRKELEIGLVLGTQFGSLESISRFDQESIREGPRSVNPMAFPNTVINSPAGHTAIRYGLTGINATISSGIVSGLQAIAYAADMIAGAQADIILAGGVEELCLSSFLGFSKTGLLSESNNGFSERSCPFDASRNGMMMAEGSAILVLEDSSHAKRRNAHVYGVIRGFGTVFGSGKDSIAKAMQLALTQAQLEPSDIGYLCASANGSKELDAMEARAIREVFQDHTERIPISSVKSMTGEALGASGGIQAAAALLALAEGWIPCTINLENCEPEWDWKGFIRKPVASPVRHVMINAVGCDQNSASLILSRYE